MKQKLLYVMAATLALSSCESAPPQTLDEKLAGKTDAQQRKILFNSCLTEAEWPNRHTIPATASITQRTVINNRYNRDVTEMKVLCRQMDALADPEAKVMLPRRELADKCTAHIKNQLKNDEHSTDHAARLRHICEDMTGQVIRYE
ncbi:MAG: hypothetical protein K2Q01_00645 [Rickettsiales bacterium]|nr:hypothetical protein [Rickettsiales bacterium]